MRHQSALSIAILLAMVCCFAAPAMAMDSDATIAAESTSSVVKSVDEEPRTEAEAVKEPWDFSPYRVLIWVASDDPMLNARSLGDALRDYLHRDFVSIWRMTIADAPSAVATAAERDLAGINFETIAASDIILAVKRNHPDAIRIRSASSVAQYVSRVFATSSRLLEVKKLAESAGNPTMDGVRANMRPIEGDAMMLLNSWSSPETEAILATRGMALTLTDPEAKLIDLPIDGLVSQVVDRYDKVFIVRIHQRVMPHQVSVVEFDTLMRYFGPVASLEARGRSEIVGTMGRAITEAFAPTIRIEEAGQDSAKGLLRAGGLILDKESPGLIDVGDVLVPMTRKNDRNGNPILIGPLDWSFLLVKKVDGVRSEMDFHTGRQGGLQGRQNQRTFRTALEDSSTR